MVDDCKKGKPRHYSSQIDQHLVVAVEEAEKSLLQGQFRQALKDANRCLVFAADPSNHGTTGCRSDDSGKACVTDHPHYVDSDLEGFCVRAPLYFPFVFDQDEAAPQHLQRPTTVCIRIEAKPSDAVDRAAAVALQSWYEVSQRISDAPVVQESHLRLLQPFWRVYATSSEELVGAGPPCSSAITGAPRSCSLELIVVMVQFCRATFHVREAAELAIATLHHVLSSEDAHRLPGPQWQHLQELLAYLLCDMLSRCTNERAVELGLMRLSGPGSSCAADNGGDGGSTLRAHALDHNNHWTLSDQTNPRAIRILVRFLENPPLHWPEECQGPLEVCRERLELELQEYQPDEDDTDNAPSSTTSHAPTGLTVALARVPVNGVREASSGRFEGLPTLGWDGNGVRLWLCRLAYLTKVSVVEPFALSPHRWSNRGMLAVSVWAFWMAWRQRGKFYRSSKRALRAALKPLQEVIDSLISPSTRR